MTVSKPAAEQGLPELPAQFLMPAGSAGTRLDAALALFWPGSALRARRRLWTWCRILVNGRARQPGHIVASGDCIRVEAVKAPTAEGSQSASCEQPEARQGPARAAVPVQSPCARQNNPAPAPGEALSCDNTPVRPLFSLHALSDEYAVFSKPAGLHSAHIAGGRGASLESLLSECWERLYAAYLEREGLACVKGAGQRPLLLTRLDRATSGLILAARSTEAARGFRRWERDGRVEKYYYALVRGHVPAPLLLRGRLLTSGGALTRISGQEDSDRARHTEVVPLARLPLPPPWPQNSAATLLRVRIRRGARHQIRVHLAGAGYPLLGERQYAPPPALDCPLFLHHAELRLPGFSTRLLPEWEAWAPVSFDFK